MKYILFLILLFSCFSQAKQIRIALVDTGIDTKAFPQLKICDSDSKSFIDYSKYNQDDLGHGTLMARIIDHYAKSTDYCFVVIKVFGKRRGTTAKLFTEGLVYLSKLKNLDIVNISAGGGIYNEEEKRAINYMIERKVVVVTAAGNENTNLDYKCNYFPACYTPDSIVVSGKNCKNCNKGKIVDIYGPYRITDKKGKVLAQGTSISTAFVSGNLVKVLNKL